jgi:hypothetical protein
MAGRTGATSIPRDVQEFLEDYPGQEDNAAQTANLKFYRNEIRCRPDGLLIDEIHEKSGSVPFRNVLFYNSVRWLGKYETLEYKHGFIQWLYVSLWTSVYTTQFCMQLPNPRVRYELGLSASAEARTRGNAHGSGCGPPRQTLLFIDARLLRNACRGHGLWFA